MLGHSRCSCKVVVKIVHCIKTEMTITFSSMNFRENLFGGSEVTVKTFQFFIYLSLVFCPLFSSLYIRSLHFQWH
jgi:hypothetical protein